MNELTKEDAAILLFALNVLIVEKEKVRAILREDIFDELFEKPVPESRSYLLGQKLGELGGASVSIFRGAD